MPTNPSRTTQPDYPESPPVAANSPTKNVPRSCPGDSHSRCQKQILVSCRKFAAMKNQPPPRCVTMSVIAQQCTKKAVKMSAENQTTFRTGGGSTGTDSSSDSAGPPPPRKAPRAPYCATAK